MSGSDCRPVEVLDVCADLVIGDGPVVTHVTVIRQHKYRDVFRDLSQLPLHVVVGPKRSPASTS